MKQLSKLVEAMIEARTAAGLSQIEVAKSRTGETLWSQSLISQVENGGKYPTVELVRNYESRCGITNQSLTALRLSEIRNRGGDGPRFGNKTPWGGVSVVVTIKPLDGAEVEVTIDTEIGSGLTQYVLAVVDGATLTDFVVGECDAVDDASCAPPTADLAHHSAEMATQTTVRGWRPQGRGRRPVAVTVPLVPVESQADRSDLLSAVPDGQVDRVMLFRADLTGLVAPISLQRRFRWMMRRPLYYWATDRDLYLEAITFDVSNLDEASRLGSRFISFLPTMSSAEEFGDQEVSGVHRVRVQTWLQPGHGALLYW